MKWTQSVAILLATAMLLGAAGCGSTQTVEYEEDTAVYTNTINGAACNAGKLYYDYEKNLLTFYDLQAETAFPICDQVNCRHVGGSCGAYFPFVYTSISGYALYQGQIYYWQSPDNGNKLDFYRCDVNGSNRKCIYSGDMGGTEILEGVYTNGKFYYAGYTELPSLAVELKNGYDPDAAQALISIDLESGKQEIVTESVREEEGRISLMAKYDENGALYYYRTDGNLHEDVDPEGYAHLLSTYFRYDPDSEEHTELFSAVADEICIKGGFAYYTAEKCTKIVRTNLETGETETILTGGKYHSIQELDGKLVYLCEDKTGTYSDYYVWNPDTGESTKITSRLPNHTKVAVSAETQTAFWGVLDDPQWIGNLRFCWISKEDFWNGQGNYHLLTEEAEYGA